MKSNKTSFLFFCSLFCLLFVGNKAYSQLQLIDSSEYYIKLYQNPKKNEDLIKSLRYFQDQQLYFNHKNNELLESKALISIAQIQKRIGYVTDSEKTTVDALKLIENIKGNDSIVERRNLSLYDHLGKIYREYKNYDKAIFYYKKAL